MFKLQRESSNPILSPRPDLSWEKEGVFNPGITKFKKKIYLLYRAVGEKKSYISQFGLAKSYDGISFQRVADKPILRPIKYFDRWGIEDPRIVKINNYFYITYVAVAKRIMKNGSSIKHFLPLETSSALLKTKDFITYKNLGIISPPNSDNKDIVLFPEKIKGRYYMLHRPNRWSKQWFNGPYEKYLNEGLPCDVKDLPKIPSIWLASSADLQNWTNHRLLISSSGANDFKLGPGVPPLKTKAGWLIIYHHVKKNKINNQLTYSTRAALLDLKDPSKLLAKLNYDILAPEKDYETEQHAHITFPTGGFISGQTLYIYYGASDRYVCLATGSITALLTELKKLIK